MDYGPFRIIGGERIIPNYFPCREVIDLDNQIIQLGQEYKDLLMYIYMVGCSWDDASHYMEKSLKWVEWNLYKAEDELLIP